MAPEPLLIELDDPIPATLRLPGIGGIIEAVVAAVEVQTDGDLWIRVRFPAWQRWRTQVRVGQPAVEGIGPTTSDMWAPGCAVEIDGNGRVSVEEKVRLAKAYAACKPKSPTSR